MRKIPFQNDHYYHIYNRGVDKRNIFLDEKDYFRFLIYLRELNIKEPIESLYRLNQIRENQITEAEPLRSSEAERRGLASELVDIVCYSLLPNHFRLLLKQRNENGISKFMQKIGTGYTMYFNTKQDRSGSLFQGTYKATEIKSEARLWKMSCYINGNLEIHGIMKASDWPWSSCVDYLGLRKGTLCNKNIILNDFDNILEYKDLMDLVVDDVRAGRDELKNFQLEIL